MLVPFHKITPLFLLSLFKSSLVIVDPTAEEEDLATGALTIVTDEEGNLCSVYKPGTVLKHMPVGVASMLCYLSIH